MTVIDNPGLLNTDVPTACSVAAAYLVDRYRDRNRGVLGNMRYCIAGSERGFDLGIEKDQAFYDQLDESWITPPEIRTIDGVEVPYDFPEVTLAPGDTFVAYRTDAERNYIGYTVERLGPGGIITVDIDFVQ